MKEHVELAKLIAEQINTVFKVIEGENHDNPSS